MLRKLAFSVITCRVVGRYQHLKICRYPGPAKKRGGENAGGR